MASKNIHAEPYPDQALIDLGFEDADVVGMVQNNLYKVDVTISESYSQYVKIQCLLETETTNDLTTVKKAFILPMADVSTDRLKAALKEHKISVTNDYEKADFIVPHLNFYDSYSSIDTIPQTKMMFHLKNGYYCNDHRTCVVDYYMETENNVVLDKRSLGDKQQWNIEYDSLPYDSYIFSNMAISIASLIEAGDLQVIETDTILNQSANRVPMTEELMQDIEKMVNHYASDEEIQMAGKIIPTIDPTGEPYLLYKYSKEYLGNLDYKYSRNKDVIYWLQKHSCSYLSRMNAEDAIKHFEQEGILDSRCFRALEVECRKEIVISNRELYTFKVQVKPEYRKYMK